MKKGDRLDDNEYLLRRVYRSDKRYIDKKTGRPTSRAFVPRPKDEGKLSVDIERLTTYEKAVMDSKRFVLFGFLAQLAYSLGLNCIYDPIDKENIAHALVTGFPVDDESIPGILARKAQRVTML
jgi:hypothetical protein